MASLLLKNAEIVATFDSKRREIRGGGLFAEDGQITQVAATEDLPSTADTVIDASGHLVLPGLVNTHHHLNQTLTRNLPTAQNINLFPWLEAHYRIWAATGVEASRVSTQIGLAELLLSGCTTVFDHSYVFRNGNCVDVQIEAAKELGVRFHASRGAMSLGHSQGGLPPDDCVEKEADILSDSERVIAEYHQTGYGAMTQIALAPCSPFSVTESLLRDSADLAREKGVMLHTHLCETLDEESFTLGRYGVRPVEWMHGLGWSGPDVWYAHAIHLEDEEIAQFASTGCGAAHCPCSNMRLGSGIAPVKKCMDAGVRIGLGVDGSASNDSSNMLLEVRQAMLLARLRLGLLPPDGPRKMMLLPASHPARAKEWMTAREALTLATLGGAQVLQRSDIGSLAVGKCADFFTLDLGTLAFAGGLSDPVAAAVFCGPHPAHTTVVNGKVLVRDGMLLNHDLKQSVHLHNQWSKKLYDML